MFSLQASRTRQDELPASVSGSRSYDTITQDFPDINLPGRGCLQEAWAGKGETVHLNPHEPAGR